MLTQTVLPDAELVAAVKAALAECQREGVKKSRWYWHVRSRLTPDYRPFDIMTAYQYVTHDGELDWDACRKIAAAIARRR